VSKLEKANETRSQVLQAMRLVEPLAGRSREAYRAYWLLVRAAGHLNEIAHAETALVAA